MTEKASGAAANKPSLLWVDLARHPTSLFEEIGDLFPGCKILDREGVLDAIHELSPACVGFEYDHPREPDLQLLQETANRYPTLPLLMLTDDRSKELMLRAYHAGVWSYVVKPVAVHDLFEKIRVLMAVADYRAHNPPKTPVAHSKPNYSQLAISSEQPGLALRTHPALTYIAENYDKKISLGAVAEVCRMSPGQFSRAFRKEHGVSFSQYVIRHRLDRACELLTRVDALVKEAAFSVGFSDLSYFTRLFRRRLAMTPSEFKARQSSLGSPGGALADEKLPV